MNIKERVSELNQELIELRRYFHQNAEVSWQEFNTQKKIISYLEELHIPYVTAAKTGVIATIEGEHSGDTILGIRADIDALPMTELADVPFRSVNEGSAHTCGHDNHAAILLVTAKVLSEMRDQLKVKVRLIFQPAEEFIEDSGAKYMAKEPLVQECQRIIGLHVTPLIKAGYVHLPVGPLMASADTFDIEIQGKGGHGAHPDLSIDPIPAAAELISSLQRIVSRELSPLEPAVISITSVHSGTTFNIIPENAHLQGTCRTFNNDIRDQFPALIDRVCQGVAAATKTNITLDFHYGTPATINDEAPVHTGRKAIENALGAEKLTTLSPSMGGEDFAKYEAEKCYMLLGTGYPEPERCIPAHNPYFLVDESGLSSGVAYFVQYVLEYQQELEA